MMTNIPRQVVLPQLPPTFKGNRNYNMTAAIYQGTQRIIPIDACFMFMFTNVGDTTAFVNGMVIFPAAIPGTTLGDSRTIGAHEGDIYKGNIDLKFATPLGVLPQVEITQLFYL